MSRSEVGDAASVDALIALEESQGSQIMQALLAPSDHSAGSLGQTHNNSNSVPSSINNKSFDPSSNNSHTGSSGESGAGYHFHGLASTQTQTETQYEEPNSGSQKENTPSSGSGNLVSSQRSAPAGPRTGRSSTTSPGESDQPFSSANNGQVSSQPLATRSMQVPQTPFKVPTTKAVSFVSPRRTPPPPHTRLMRSPIRASRRSPSPASQDSFAGPSVYDPAQHFIATNKQFDIPISELGRDDFSQDSQSDVGISRSGRDMVSYNHTVSSDYDGKYKPLPHSSSSQEHPGPVGRVLVKSTPSNSSTSQSQSQSQSQGSSRRSQQSSESQRSGITIPSQISLDEATGQQQPSLYEDEYTEEFPPNLPEDRPASVTSEHSQQSQEPEISANHDSQETQQTQETQLLSEPEGTAGSDRELDDFPSTSGTGASRSSGRPGSLAATIAPGKLHRYKGAIAHGKTARTQNDSAKTPTQSIPETVFSGRSSNAGPPRKFDEVLNGDETQMQEARALTPPRSLPMPPPSRPSTLDQDFVPDSEPPRGTPLDPPLAKKRPQWSPTTPRRRAALEREEEDMVDDSLAVASQSVVGDDDEDELRLTKASAKASWSEKLGKGKNRTMGPPPPPSLSMKRSIPPPPPLRQKQRQGRQESLEHTQGTEVPSSEPQQDALQAKPGGLSLEKVPEGPPNSKKSRKGKEKATAPPPQSDTDDEEVPLSRTARRRITDMIPLEEEEEEGTEAAEEEDNEEDDEDDGAMDDYIPGTSTRKRKRKLSRRESTMVATPPRSIKRLRTATNSQGVISVMGTRVLALWGRDQHYYSGTVNEILSDPPEHFDILFDDGDSGMLPLAKLRVCNFVEGDTVKYNGSTPATVIRGGASRVTIKVEGKGKLQGQEIEADVNQLRVHFKTVQSRWGDRLLNATDLYQCTRVRALSTSPSKTSFASIDRGIKSQIFAGVAFLVTLKNQTEAERRSINKVIHDNGGKVVSDWTSLLSYGGTHVDNKKRYQTLLRDVSLSAVAKIYKSVVLVADESNMKPKFLIALALGVPCLSERWLYDSTNEDELKAWQSHLLPAGYCEPLKTRVSQLVDYDNADCLATLLRNTVPFKLFKDKSVLCIGAEFFPAPKNSRNSGQEADNKTWIPRIVLAMGAVRVDAVTQAQHAPPPSTFTFDYVIISSDELPSRVKGSVGQRSQILRWSWVKECLIAGRWLDVV